MKKINRSSFKLIVWLIPVFSVLLGILTGCTNPEKSDNNWFPFSPLNTFEQGETGMEEWLDAPAGKHGFAQINGKDLVFEDGTPVKFWGTNICSRLPYVASEKADSFVNFLAKYGVNAVRFHKFTWYAYDGQHSTLFSPEKFKPFDYFHSKLREKGIYVGWSHIYGHKVLPGDSSKILAYEEIKNLRYPWSHLNGTTSSLVNFAPDLQELNIALTLDMLNHENPNTGLRYADDPALAFIEFQNEDNIFWGAIERSLEQAPTYRALLCRMFSDWLMKKYGSQKALENAWGKENIPEGESLEKRNIYPQPNHGLFSWEYETALKENRPVKQHYLDKMRFLYETQMAFYEKFEKAIRSTGYKGVLVGSCWQAGSGISHLYNLYADYKVGMIDRHNYFGGGAGGHRLDTGFVRAQHMLSQPGSGLLSTGLQQVVDRPFSFSEWMSLVPNQYTAEAAPLIAVYGMGLQGWDASFSFATDIPRFSRYLQSEGHGVYNATSPLHIGFYPALARMVYRNDIAESPVITTRNVHIPSLAEGKTGFVEKVDQGYDDKRFSGTVTPEMLAIGKMPVQFTNTYEKTSIAGIAEYWDSISKTIRAVTGELQWNYSDKGYVTVNTSHTKGFIGFNPDKEIMLDDWKMTIENPFAIVLVTSLSKGDNLDNAEKILVTTIARAKNSGMEYNETGDSLLSTGEMPLLMEPVNATLYIPFQHRYTVEILDHDGLPTKRFISRKKGRINFEGSEYKAIWYVIRQKH